ncbi:MAG: 1-acyl-sn-glycerol-3-phosphate acyltransferase [Gemmatimonadales bacterium]|nr:MAG: 1-acyl-sn-glycerol-3-phosphate acyltransferase [Gemmatimonadales bacterium]
MHPLYRILTPPTRWFVKSSARIRVEGVAHMPRTGGFLLLPNHQSALDPFVVQSFCPRPIRSMTKSTQFGVPLVRWLLPRIGAFPVRRFQVDAQAVRTALRFLRNGEGVCIYPEGERTWDGSIQPFRRGTLHLALRSGVPIIPVGLNGMFDLWPRWLSTPRPRPQVTLRFGEPLEFGEVRDRHHREEMLPALEALLTQRLAALSGAPVSSDLRRRVAEAGGGKG